MIVSERNVSDALSYLADDPHPLALARKHVLDAENELKRIQAESYLKTEGTVKERESIVDISKESILAKDELSEAILELERHKARVNAASMLIEVWRTENANIRAAERVR